MTLWQDVRFSLRSLRRNPALAATCLIVLALGIGANTAIFSAVKAILLDPLPYHDPGRLMALYEAEVVPGDVHDEPAPGNFYDWRHDSESFEDIAAYAARMEIFRGKPAACRNISKAFSVRGICSERSGFHPLSDGPSRPATIPRKPRAQSS